VKSAFNSCTRRPGLLHLRYRATSSDVAEVRVLSTTQLSIGMTRRFGALPLFALPQRT
jgi:hypothetical protein